MTQRSGAISALQLKALMLITMLAGQEAMRINDAANAMAALNQNSSFEAEGNPDEEAFQTLNHECAWATLSGGCTGEGCKWRRLSLDWPPPSSQSCRHTDDYMLKNNGADNYKTIVGVLAAKSKKYAENCEGASMFNRKCKRRQEQMMRAMKFIAKGDNSKDLMKSMTPEDKAEQKQRFETSMSNIASTMGQDGSLVLHFANKMKADSAVEENPKAAVQKIMQLLTALAFGTEDEQEEARVAMINFAPSAPLTPQEKQAAAERNSKLADKLSSETDEVAAEIDRVDFVSPDNIEDSEDGIPLPPNTTSMLQVRSKGWAANAIAFTLLALLVTAVVIFAVLEVMAAILTWALLALLGCGAYAAGHDNAARKSDGEVTKMGFTGFFKCFAKVFAFPFILIGGVVVATYRFFSSDKPNKLDEPNKLDDDAEEEKKRKKLEKENEEAKKSWW